MTKKKELKVEFAPGAFDHFEGTQEELDAMIAEITQAIQSGEFMENSSPVNMESLQEEDPELYDILLNQLDSIENPKKLN